MKQLSKKRQLKFIKEEKARAFRKLVKEYEEVYFTRRNEFVELDEPLFHGYKKFWVLRDDWARSPQANTLRRILDKVNSTIYSRKKNFACRSKSFRKDVVELPGFKDLTPEQYEKLSNTEKKYFYKTTTRHWGNVKEVYALNNIYYFVPKVVKHYINRVPLLDPDRESRRAELNDFIFDYGCYRKGLKRMCGDFGWVFPDKSYSRDDLRDRMVSNLAKLDVQSQYNEYLDRYVEYDYFYDEDDEEDENEIEGLMFFRENYK
jgi:hypothetical protein